MFPIAEQGIIDGGAKVLPWGQKQRSTNKGRPGIETKVNKYSKGRLGIETKVNK